MGEYYGVRREGEPYIEHFGLPKGWIKQGHKYIARIKNAAGDGYRYIYTQAELAAAQGRKAARAVGKITKDTYKVVRKNVDRAARSADRTLGLSARRKAQATAAAADRYKGPRTKGDYRNQPNPTSGRIARDKAKRAQAAYDKTLLGQAEKAFNSGRKAVNDAAKNASKQANKLYKQAGKSINDTADQVGRGVDRAIRNIDNKYGITASGKRAKKASDYKQKMIDRRNSLSYPDRVDANDAARAGRYAGHGPRNRDTVEYKNSLNLRRAKTRVHRGVQKEQMARNREETQQARVAGIRGNGLMATKVAGAFGRKNGDEFNKDKPVTMKSKKAKREALNRKKHANTATKEPRRGLTTAEWLRLKPDAAMQRPSWESDVRPRRYKRKRRA